MDVRRINFSNKHLSFFFGIQFNGLHKNEFHKDLLNKPWEINMEHTNHPFRKENDLNQTSMIMFHVNLQGCTSCFLQDFLCLACVGLSINVDFAAQNIAIGPKSGAAVPSEPSTVRKWGKYMGMTWKTVLQVVSGCGLRSSCSRALWFSRSFSNPMISGDASFCQELGDRLIDFPTTWGAMFSRLESSKSQGR